MRDRTRAGPRRAKGVPELARGDEQPNVRYRRLAQLYLNIPRNTLPPHARHSLLEMAKTCSDWRRNTRNYLGRSRRRFAVRLLAASPP
jgi:hypothetical protein